MRGEPTVVGPECRIHGTISSHGDVLVFGHVQGAIEAGGTVRIFDGGIVDADVTAAVVRVEGDLDGTVRASQRVSVGPRGRLIGDIHGVLSIDDGGFVQSRNMMISPPRAPSPTVRAPVKPQRVYHVDPPRAPSAGAIPSISETDINDALFQMGSDPEPQRTPAWAPAQRPPRIKNRARGRTDPGTSRPPGATISSPLIQAVTTGEMKVALKAGGHRASPLPQDDVVHTPPPVVRGTNPGLLIDEWFEQDDDLLE